MREFARDADAVAPTATEYEADGFSGGHRWFASWLVAETCVLMLLIGGG
jgi:hypothetical protein